MASIVNWPPGCYLVTLQNGSISRAQCWSLLLADLALNRSYRQNSLGEWKFMLLSPCITLNSATMTIWFVGQLDWGRRLAVHRMGHLTSLSPQQKSPFDQHLDGKRIFTSFAYLERSVHIFPRCLSHQFSNHDLSKPLIIQTVCRLQPMNW